MDIRKVENSKGGKVIVYLRAQDVGHFFFSESLENALDDNFEFYVFVAEFENDTEFWLYGVGSGRAFGAEMYAQLARVRCRLIENKATELEEDDEFVFEIDTYPLRFELVDALPSLVI